MEKRYEDRFWTSDDGLKLHFRDYRASKADSAPKRPPIMCLHGLTRNARDFAELAERLASDWRVIVPEMRGRGESEYAADPATYNPMQYVEDVHALIEQEGIERFIAIGTSMGGLITMLYTVSHADRVAAVVLNDIGPDVASDGLERIREYVGKGGSFATWMHAARAMQEQHEAAFPNLALEDWLEMAKRTMILQPNGRIGYDYDMKIAEPFAQDEGAAPANLWPAFDALNGRPVLIVRGQLSDILTTQTLKQMQARLPQADVVTVPDVGHAPMLDEPAAIAAIEGFLADLRS